MRIMDASHVGLVIAAREGDRRARDELISLYLPLVYNIVGHALRGHADVDDVVQETLLRAVRDLPAVRDPGSFRSWLVAIAIHQISGHMRRHRADGAAVAVFDEGSKMPHPAGFEETAILRLELSDQRRQTARASRWLDPEHRLTLSLWWQENTGRLTRREVATALGVSVAHAGVRLQRMRDQLDQGRAIVAALAAEPRCRRLSAAIEDWGGEHSPLWRKRIGRHLRGCPACRTATGARIPLERLLLTFAPLAVPAGLITKKLTAAVSVAAGAKVGLIGKLVQAVMTHPVVGTLTGTALVVVGTVAYVAVPEPRPQPPVVISAPTAGKPEPVPATPEATAIAPPRPSPSEPGPSTEAPVPDGTLSLESVAAGGQYLTYDGDFAALTPLSGASDEQSRRRATLTVVEGLADTDCVTFRTSDGRYLRHSNLRLRLNADEGTELFREDATFCQIAGATNGSVALRAHNYPGSMLRYRDGGIYLDGSDGSAAFARETSFVVRDPLTG